MEACKGGRRTIEYDRKGYNTVLPRASEATAATEAVSKRAAMSVPRNRHSDVRFRIRFPCLTDVQFVENANVSIRVSKSKLHS